MDTLGLPSKEAVEKRLTEELSFVGGKVKSICRGFDWNYGGKEIFFYVRPVSFGEQEVPIIRMTSWKYSGGPEEALHKNFPKFAKEIANLDDVVSKYNKLSLECSLHHQPNRYKPIEVRSMRDLEMMHGIDSSGCAPLIALRNDTIDPNLTKVSIRRVGGLITEELLHEYDVRLITSVTAFSKDDVIPAVYSQKEFIDLCNEKR